MRLPWRARWGGAEGKGGCSFFIDDLDGEFIFAEKLDNMYLYVSLRIYCE
jgi:hypothetical protein